MDFTSQQQAYRKELRERLTAVSGASDKTSRRRGSVVAFEAAKLLAWEDRACVAAANAYRVIKREAAPIRVTADPLDDGGDSSGTSPVAGAESGGAGDDDDGDGDGDGPRRPRPTFPLPRIRKSPSFPRLSQSKPIKVKPASSPHRDALVALVFLTTLVLSTGVALAMLGFPMLSGSVIASLTGLPSLAAKFIRPK